MSNQKPGSGACYLKDDGHRYVTLDGVEYLASHLAFLYMTGAPPKGQVEHIDGDTTNNAWANLRDTGS